jgi:DNA-binding transcriptional ArsR family regulator
VSEYRPLPDLHWLLERQIARPGTPSRGDSVRRWMTTTVFEFCQVAVAPFWGRARGFLEAERDVRARILITNGVDWLLDSLHPKLRWNPPVLEIVGGPDGDVYLDGRGLLLSPALFLPKRKCVLIDAGHPAGPPVLAFPVSFPPSLVSDLQGSCTPNEQALGALFGHTRAAALQALTDSCTTGELSQRLGISLGGASKHATILREAGLVNTARLRNTALHTLTPLGMALLQNRGWGRSHSENCTTVGSGPHSSSAEGRAAS